MPSIELKYLRTGDRPPFIGLEPVVHDNAGDWTAVVLEGGMASGQPSVVLIVKTPQGDVVLETSLLAFNAAAKGLVAMAETQFGWEMPD